MIYEIAKRIVEIYCLGPYTLFTYTPSRNSYTDLRLYIAGNISFLFFSPPLSFKGPITKSNESDFISFFPAARIAHNVSYFNYNFTWTYPLDDALDVNKNLRLMIKYSRGSLLCHCKLDYGIHCTVTKFSRKLYGAGQGFNVTDF